MHTQAERLFVSFTRFQIVNSSIGEEVGNILRLVGHLITVIKDPVIRIAVAAEGMDAPEVMAFLGDVTGTKMPFP